MIRIDEIYYNTFVSALQHRPDVGLHWFDPFGSTSFEDIKNHPLLNESQGRIFFWDQEPLHLDRVEILFDQFVPIYRNEWNKGPFWLITSEYDSEYVKWACDTYNMTSGYYFFHAWAALDWYRGYNHTFLSQPFLDRKIERTFLCPNNIIGGQRHHRVALLNELVDRELVDSNFISFPERCPYENKTVAELCQEYDIHLGHVDLPLIIDHGANHAGSSHRIDMWELANRSLLNVVTETVYSGRRQHLTEKTFRPIVMQQPFVLVSCQGSLEYLRRYGFKTFGEFWNEDYDDKDDDLRMFRIGKLLADLESLSTREKAQLQRHLAPVVEHNFQWFYSREFESLLWQELTDMVKQW
jgi:hypothetical protein